jgi:threonine synthase
MLALNEGVLAEPASCATIAGIIKLKDTLAQNAVITCTLTGNGLKDPDCAIKYAKSPVEKTSADIKDIVKTMGL